MNVVMFLGRWEVLTLLVMIDIVMFMVVTTGRVMLMYGVIFLMVIDLVVCVHVLYL